jgi:hypothetical protein
VQDSYKWKQKSDNEKSESINGTLEYKL